MDAQKYQELAARTRSEIRDLEISSTDLGILASALGLAGEAGEVADIIKKGYFHKHRIYHNQIRKELGDCLWYLSDLCTSFGFDLGDIMAENIEKLKVRYPEGFSSADSQARVDKDEDDLPF
jgi:NTP pyrophosphatase (non-canonical NTP hydrolase)